MRTRHFKILLLHCNQYTNKLPTCIYFPIICGRGRPTQKCSYVLINKDLARYYLYRTSDVIGYNVLTWNNYFIGGMRSDVGFPYCVLIGPMWCGCSWQTSSRTNQNTEYRKASSRTSACSFHFVMYRTCMYYVDWYLGFDSIRRKNEMWLWTGIEEGSLADIWQNHLT